MIDRIDTHPDGSITIHERTLEGKMLAVTYPPEAAHDELVRRGARCTEHEHRVKTTETTFETVEFDDLSDTAKAEVAENARLTPLSEDRAEIRRLGERWSVLVEQKTLAELDDRNLAHRAEVLESIAAEMAEVRNKSVLLEALVDIAALGPTDEG